jgi:hypothetical protein
MPKASHEDEKCYRDQNANELLKQKEKIKKRLNAFYFDKIDGVIASGMNVIGYVWFPSN